MREPLGLRGGLVCKAAARVSWLVIMVADNLVGVGVGVEDVAHGRRKTDERRFAVAFWTRLGRI